jgi:hypothetical protein
MGNGMPSLKFSRTRRIEIIYVSVFRTNPPSSSLIKMSTSEHKDALPPLDAAQTTKLKHLSIVSLASSHRVLFPSISFFVALMGLNTDSVVYTPPVRIIDAFNP